MGDPLDPCPAGSDKEFLGLGDLAAENATRNSAGVSLVESNRFEAKTPSIHCFHYIRSIIKNHVIKKRAASHFWLVLSFTSLHVPGFKCWLKCLSCSFAKGQGVRELTRLCKDLEGSAKGMRQRHSLSMAKQSVHILNKLIYVQWNIKTTYETPPLSARNCPPICNCTSTQPRRSQMCPKLLVSLATFCRSPALRPFRQELV